MRFKVEFDDISSGAVADTYKTIAAIRAADTAGYRCFVSGLIIGPSEDAPADLNYSARLMRVDDVSAGSAGTAGSSPTPEKVDSLSRAAVITAGLDYITGGAEPSTYSTTGMFQLPLNRRNSFEGIWPTYDLSPMIVNRDQLAGLLVAPRTAAAVAVSGVIEFTEF